jgi:hypothetical protein
MNIDELSELTFNKNELSEKSLEWVKQKAAKVASGVINSPTSKSFSGKQRTFEDIKRDASAGLVVEAFFIEHLIYTENKRRNRYGTPVWDVISGGKFFAEGVEVELKTYFYESTPTRDRHLRTLEKKATIYEHVVIFKRNNEGDYTFDSYWKLNLKTKRYEEQLSKPQSTTQFLT